MVGANMAGRDVAYRGSLLMNIVEVCASRRGLASASGTTRRPRSTPALRADRSQYRKLLFHGGRLDRRDDLRAGRATIWTTNDVGMLKGLVYVGRRTSRPWKAHLQPNPFDVKPAYIATAHDRAAAARRPSSGRPSQSPQLPQTVAVHMSPTRDGRRPRAASRRRPRPSTPTARRLRGQAPAREPLHRQDLDASPGRPRTCASISAAIGLGAKILYDEVGPKVHWDHPDNRLDPGHRAAGRAAGVGDGRAHRHHARRA